jgi:hypothetical protein
MVSMGLSPMCKTLVFLSGTCILVFYVSMGGMWSTGNRVCYWGRRGSSHCITYLNAFAAISNKENNLLANYRNYSWPCDDTDNSRVS